MMLFRLLSWPYLRRHLLRWTLTLAGIVLGVAVFVAMHTANRSIFSAFDKTVDQIAGSTQLQVSADELGFPESVLDRVQSVPCPRKRPSRLLPRSVLRGEQQRLGDWNALSSDASPP